MIGEPVLTCRQLYAGYGKTSVVRGLDVTVQSGEIVLLLGPNGAGKTTSLLTIAGLLPRISGDVEVCGHPVTSDRPYLMAKRGLSFVPDNRGLVTGLSVWDNLRLGAARGGEPIEAVLDLFPALKARRKLKSGQLSGGEQQMLAIARAISSRPKLLIIDEMSLGLAPAIVSFLVEKIRQIVQEFGTGILLVEQHIDFALQCADRAYVLVHGDMVLQADASTLREDRSMLVDAYLR